MNYSLFKKIIFNLTPPIILNVWKLFKNERVQSPVIDEFERIRNIERFKKGNTNVFGNEFEFVDSASFLFLYDEIFRTEIYKFIANVNNPIIIDAGANIGMSVLYFKKIYPDAKITAFEPDAKVAHTLEQNINNFKLENVEVVKKALWNEIKTLRFLEEGADGGRIDSTEGTTKVQTALLSDYLHEKIDLLKIDIEGAEIEVLEECKSKLHNVERIFVEFHSMIDRKQRLEKLLSILADAGFRYYISHIGIHSPTPFVEKNQYVGMDNQLNIFATRNN